jgi:hypothetical protein
MGAKIKNRVILLLKTANHNSVRLKNGNKIIIIIKNIFDIKKLNITPDQSKLAKSINLNPASKGELR